MNRPTTTGHHHNPDAYNPRDIRKCQIKDAPKGELRTYHFCSPTFTDYGGQLKYLGIGHIRQIKDQTFTEKEQPEELHFWSLKVVEIIF